VPRDGAVQPGASPAAAVALMMTVLSPGGARSDPATLTARTPVVMQAEAASCPARNERAILSVDLDPAGLPSGSAIEVHLEPSGRVIGTIAPFGTRAAAGSRGYNLVLPKDVPVCVDGRPRPVGVRLTLKPAEGSAAAFGEGARIAVRELRLATIPAAD
jgi:hypothetical protein